MRQLLFTLFTIFVFGCTSQKPVTEAIADNSIDGPKRRLELADYYFEEGDFFKAIRLYEVVINERIMIDDLERVYFFYANSHFAQYDYATASNLYNTFYQSYPESGNAETAYFYRAMCSYNLADADHRLDQTVLIQAMREFQDYVIIYPEGEHVDECMEKIEEIKLINERKQMEIGDLYFKIGEYKAAIEEYDRFIEDHPSSILVEETYYSMLSARFELAKRSYKFRQKERFEAVVEHYGYFMDKYSTGPYAAKAGELNEMALEELKKLES